MKKLLPIIILVVLVVGGCGLAKNKNSNISLTPSPSSMTTPTPTVADPETISVDVGGRKYQVSWFTLQNPEKVTLLANFTAKLSSEEIIKKYSCQNGINGGFYGKDDKPLGIFINDAADRRNQLNSNLFNGIFYITKDNKFGIEENLPKDILKLALQSGPLLILNKNILPLKINDDKLARRMVVGVSEKEIIFLSVYDEISRLQGPYLADLPKITEEFSKKTKVEITSALNLDGGSASAFYKPRISLNEITAVGSFFCVK